MISSFSLVCFNIICSLNKSAVYTGVTSNLLAQVAEHKEKAYPNSFSDDTIV